MYVEMEDQKSYGMGKGRELCSWRFPPHQGNRSLWSQPCLSRTHGGVLKRGVPFTPPRNKTSKITLVDVGKETIFRRKDKSQKILFWAESRYSGEGRGVSWTT